MERVTMLREPPVIGQAYLVPTVLYKWLGERLFHWPVFLPRHDDKEHLNFEWQHYHVDPRFLSATMWKRAANWYSMRWEHWPDYARAFATLQAVPLNRTVPGARGRETEPHPPVTWRPRVCTRAAIPYMHHESALIMAMQGHFAGQRCKRARTGWVCPHKGFPLGSIGADADGEIVCPLHGLRIDPESGRVIAPAVRP